MYLVTYTVYRDHPPEEGADPNDLRAACYHLQEWFDDALCARLAHAMRLKEGRWRGAVIRSGRIDEWRGNVLAKQGEERYPDEFQNAKGA